MPQGVIIKGIAGFYYVKVADHIVECKARGKFRNESVAPMVGDRVEINEKSGKGSIEKIYARKSMLVRPAVANIDQLLVVVAVASPDPNPALIDHFLILGETNGLDTILCLNKIDLAGGEELERIYQQAGYRVICTDAAHHKGIDVLRPLLKGRITALAGNSGVGKSSILNALGVNLHLKTGAVSEKIHRGRHTTRHVELLELTDGGFVLDTPGFSSFSLPDIKAEDLQNYFPEFVDCIGKCRFRGCAHIGEPDCAVHAKLEQGRISQMRYDSYVQLYTELKKVKEWEK